eukprot:2474051-Rhodomonas_salina.2
MSALVLHEHRSYSTTHLYRRRTDTGQASQKDYVTTRLWIGEYEAALGDTRGRGSTRTGRKQRLADTILGLPLPLSPTLLDDNLEHAGAAVRGCARRGWGGRRRRAAIAIPCSSCLRHQLRLLLPHPDAPPEERGLTIATHRRVPSATPLVLLPLHGTPSSTVSVQSLGVSSD